MPCRQAVQALQENIAVYAREPAALSGHQPLRLQPMLLQKAMARPAVSLQMLSVSNYAQHHSGAIPRIAAMTGLLRKLYAELE